MSLGKSDFYSDAILEVTKHCNAHCDCCYTADNNSMDLSFKQITQVIDKISEVGILTLNFTGGEPFSRKDFKEILQYSIDKNFWHFSILSNGTLLKDEDFSFLEKNSSYFKNFQMSLFSHDPKIHDQYMGIKNSHKIIINTADILRSFKIPVTLSFNILDINMYDYQKTMDLMLLHSDVQQVGVTKLFDNCHKNCNFKRLEDSTSAEFYTRMFKASPEFLKSQKNKLSKTSQIKIDPEKASLCSGVFTSIFIDSVGDMRPCPAFRNIKGGNIFENGTIYDIVSRYPNYKKIKSLKISDLSDCNKCKYNTFCNICIGLSHSETNSLKKVSHQYCNFVHALENL